MAKKNAGKVIQMLSPENYIRKKARSLPIHECLVNQQWQDQDFANLIVARSHTNGNITACMYLVDLYCLGIKDTHYLFNTTKLNYQEKFGGNDKLNFKPISYTMAHNIVYAGLEFAQKYGFKPHKEFTSTTRFMLEEDTEDVELIDIECGKNGKPLYVSGPYDDDTKTRKIIAQLEKTAGAGNYDYILPGSDDEFEDNEEYLDKIERLSLEEKCDIFLDLNSREKTLNDDDADRLSYVTNSLFKELVDYELADQLCAEYMDDLDIGISDVVSDEMLGIIPGSAQITDESRELFLKIFIDTVNESKLARTLLAKFRKITPDIPASYFLELQILKEEDSPQFPQKLQEYATKFPDYSLIKLQWLGDIFSSETMPAKYLNETYNLRSIFPGRKELHSIEMFHFLLFKLTELLRKGDAARLEGFCLAYEELNLSDDELDILDELASIVKTHFIEIYLNK